MRRFVWILWIACFLAALVGRAAAQDASTSKANTRAADLEAEISYRIIGGLPAADNAWPWQIALFMRSGNGAFSFIAVARSLIEIGF
jgi:hypothetical protein